MLFNFTLRPLEQVQPWGEPGILSLSWFGLSDGHYWIQAGKDVLLEYSEHSRTKHGVARYCDYQIARLYEDLMAILPGILEAVPPTLVPYISGESGRAWSSKFSAWHNKVGDVIDDDHLWDIAYINARWIADRSLDTIYLSPSANIRIWSEQASVYIDWDNTDKLIGGMPAWTATRGSFRLSREAFIQEVQSFHARFMEQMAERVKRVVGGALPSDVQIDLPGLKREQAQRCKTMQKVFDGPPAATDWESVRKAIAEVEREADGLEP